MSILDWTPQDAQDEADAKTYRPESMTWMTQKGDAHDDTVVAPTPDVSRD